MCLLLKCRGRDVTSRSSCRSCQTQSCFVLTNKTYMRYKYTSFFWSRSAVAMFFNTSGNSAETSLPRVMDMIVF